MSKKIGEQWVRTAGRSVGETTPWILLLFAIAAIAIGSVLPEQELWLSCIRTEWAIAMLLLLLALLSFERRTFYRIIEAQQERIDYLEFKQRAGE